MPDTYPQAPQMQTPPTVAPDSQQTNAQTIETKQSAAPGQKELFQSAADMSRINTYDFYERLFMGQHFSAFSIKVSSEQYGKEYARLRYLVANFPGLISKVVADLLFIEPPKIQVKEQGGDQEFVDELVKENKLRIRNYESALANSYFGDSLYKVRVGKRHPSDTDKTVIIDEITPKVYYPKLNPFDVKGKPEEICLAWKFKRNGKDYAFKEIHMPGKIENKVLELNGNEIIQTYGAKQLFPDIEDAVETKIDDLLVVHVPNWRAGNNHFGISDYFDLDTLFYAMNNRLFKIDNILDKHSDPILAIPPGILDEDGKVKRNKLGLFERPDGVNAEGDPAYITWDANLESGFKEIEKLVELTFMMSETSPDILGMGQGQAESGRALKLKLLRTLAKAQRKQLYYTEALKQVIYLAQVAAKEWDLQVNGKKLKGEPTYPEIVWSDGLPADMQELIDQEAKRIDAGLTTKAESIARLDDIDIAEAEKKAAAIKKENELAMPKPNIEGSIPGIDDKEKPQPPKNEPQPNKGAAPA